MFGFVFGDDDDTKHWDVTLKNEAVDYEPQLANLDVSVARGMQNLL